ncbi:hypothetical protein KRX54_02070 [Actinomycetaceae bacterium TAE3-ERU4]|nr:hypothetical protein [Actinomycetaceae bacterium TAE3-ERU4]
MTKKTLLFISTGGTNSACAALLVRAAGIENIEAFAAYTDKRMHEVDKTMVTLLAEDGLNLEEVTPLYYGEDLLREATHVINLGTGITADLPTFNWETESTDGRSIPSIRESLEKLRWEIKKLLDTLR